VEALASFALAPFPIAIPIQRSESRVQWSGVPRLSHRLACHRQACSFSCGPSLLRKTALAVHRADERCCKWQGVLRRKRLHPRAYGRSTLANGGQPFDVGTL